MESNSLEEYEIELERREALEHRDVLLAIGAILRTPEGLTLFKYLFKNLEVASLPDINYEGNMLHDKLGFLRAGNSIYKLACEADFNTTASIIAKLERMKYEQLCEQHRISTTIEDADS